MPYWEDEEDDDLEEEQDSEDTLDEALFNVGVQVTDTSTVNDEVGTAPEEMSVSDVAVDTITDQPVTSNSDISVVMSTNIPEVKTEYEASAAWHSDDYSDKEETTYVSKQIDVTKKATAVEYPMLYLKLNNQSTVELNLLKNMLRTSCQDADAMYFHIYLDVCNSVIKPQGVLRNVELKTLLSSSIFENVDKYIKLDENTTISGDMMFALCAADC